LEKKRRVLSHLSEKRLETLSHLSEKRLETLLPPFGREETLLPPFGREETPPSHLSEKKRRLLPPTFRRRGEDWMGTSVFQKRRGEENKRLSQKEGSRVEETRYTKQWYTVTFRK